MKLPNLLNLLNLLFFLLPLTAFAQETENTNVTTVEAPEKDQNHFTVGLKVDSYKYEEPDFMNDKGTMYGVEGSFQSKSITEHTHAEVRGSVVQGQITYNGSITDLTTNVDTPYSSREQVSIFELQGLWFWDLIKEDTEPKLSAFVGLGFRYLVDPKDDQYDYRREITYRTIPVGLRFGLMNTNTTKMSLRAEYDDLIYGTAKTYLSDTDPSLPDLNQRQNTGYGWRASLDMDYKIWGNLNLATSLYYEAWEIADSETNRVVIADQTFEFVEPRNRTEVFGVMLGTTF